MPNLYVYGKEYGRFDVNTIKQHIDSDLIEKAFSLSDEEEIEEWMCSDEVQSLDWTIMSLLSGMVADLFFEGQRKSMIEQWKKDGCFGVELEEYSFGVGKTIEEAKVMWVNVDGDDDSKDW